MDPWKTKLFLDALDDRIVPDATPLADPDLSGTGNNAYVTGTAPVASYDFGNGTGSGNNAYDPATSSVGNNAYTSGSGVSSFDFGSGSGTGNNSYTSSSSGSGSGFLSDPGTGNNSYTHGSGSGVSTYDFGSGSGTSNNAYEPGSDFIPRLSDAELRLKFAADSLTQAANKLEAAANDSIAKTNQLLTDTDALTVAKAKTDATKAALVAKGFDANQIAADAGYKADLAAQTLADAARIKSRDAQKEAGDKLAEAQVNFNDALAYYRGVVANR